MSPCPQHLETTIVTFSFLIFFPSLFERTTRHVGSQFPERGWNLGSLWCTCRVLTTELLGKSPLHYVFCSRSLSTQILAVSVISHTVFVFLLLDYFSIMSFRFMQVIAHVRIFFFMAEYYSFVCMHHILFIHSYNQWTFELRPPLGFCEQCCQEHGFTDISS